MPDGSRSHQYPRNLVEQLAVVGIRLQSTRAGTYRFTCPQCSSVRRKSTEKCLAVTVNRDGASAVWNCHHCGWSGARSTADSTKRHSLKPRPRIITPKPRLLIDPDKPRRLFARALSIQGTPVERYLTEVRGSLILPPNSAVRFMPAAPPRFPWPSMVSMVTAFSDATHALTLHFTDLLPDGSGKAPTTPNKHTLKGYLMKGGVVRLTADAAVERRLGVAEGIEKALSVATSYARDLSRTEHVWSALSARNMGELPVLPGIETLAIYGDKNEVGRKAVATLKRHWLDAGCEVETHFPLGVDWDEAP